jgi:glycosyltransferase involved in cell wall biosynthesis
MDTISKIVNYCNVSVTTFKNISVHSTNSPNMLFDSLSAAKPIIVNSNGWTRKIVEDHNCGAYVDPENPNELVYLLLRWKNEHQLLKEMVMNGRKLAETTFDKSIITKKFVATVKKHF